jgi:hypothetical protein
VVEFGFLHLPKTAGTSIASAMADPAALGRIVDKDMDQRLFGAFTRFDSMDPAIRSRILIDDEIDAVHEAEFGAALGHFSLDTLVRLGARTIVTVLREPRVRVLSHYLYLRSWPAEAHAIYGTYDHTRKAAGSSLAEFLGDATSLSQIDNVQSRMILPADLVPPDRPLSRQLANVYREALARRLDRFALVGLTEGLQAFRARLSILWGREVSFPRLNETATGDAGAPLDAEGAALLDERTWLDAWLYDQAGRGSGLPVGPEVRDAIFLAALRKYGITLAV